MSTTTLHFSLNPEKRDGGSQGLFLSGVKEKSIMRGQTRTENEVRLFHLRWQQREPRAAVINFVCYTGFHGLLGASFNIT